MAEASLRPVRRDVTDTPAVTWQRAGDPGAREMFEEGRSQLRESLARALSARAIQHEAKASRGERGSLVIGVPPQPSLGLVEELDEVASRRESDARVTWSGPRASEGVSGAAAQFHGRGLIARRVCLRVVGVAEVVGRCLAQRSATRFPPKPKDRLRRRGLALEGTAARRQKRRVASG